MESTFRIIFWAGLAGCVGWFWYAVLLPVTALVEAVGVFSGTLLVIGVAGLLYEKARKNPRGADAVAKVSVIAKEVADGGGEQIKLRLSKIQKKHWALVAVVSVVAFAGWSYWGSVKQTEADLASATSYARSACTSFINKEFNNNSRSNPARVYGDWQKNEHIVVEIVWNRGYSGGSLDSRLCVYNPETRRMHSPGAFGRERWEQY